MTDIPRPDRPDRLLFTSLQSGLLLVTLVFIGIPWLGGLLLLDMRAGAVHDRAVEADLAKRRDVLARLTVLGNAEKRYDELISRLAETPLQPAALARRAARLIEREQGALDLTIFDAGCSPVPLPGQPQPPKRASERFMKALLAGGEDPQPKLLAAFGGDPDAARLMAGAPGSLVKLENAFIRSWGGWWTVRTRQGRVVAHIVAFVHRGKIDHSLLMDRAVSDARRLIGGEMLIGWVHPYEPSQLRPAGVDWPAGLGQCLASTAPDVSTFFWNGRSVLLVDGIRGERLVAISSATAPVHSTASGSKFALSAAAAGLALIVLVFGPAASRRLGLRGKLVTLFMTGGGLLLAGLMMTVLFDRADRERVLIEEYKKRHLRLLARIDQDFLSELFPILREYEIALKLAGAASDEEAADIVRRHVEPLMDRIRPVMNGMVIIDTTPKVRFFDSGFKTGRRKNETRKFMTHVGRLLMLEFQGKATQLSGTRGDPTLIEDIIANSMYYAIRAGMQLQFQQLLDQGMITYTNVAGDASGRVKAVLIALHDSCRAQRKYLRRVTAGWPWSDTGARFAAIPLSPDPAWRSYSKISTGNDLELRRWRDRVAGERLPVHGVARIHNNDYLVTAMPGTRLGGYVLMIAQPMQEIEGLTKALGRSMGGLSLAILALVVGVTAAMATRLLRPLERLEYGLEAIRRRDFHARIQEGGVYELDRLGMRVNFVAENLHDLQIARSVQEQLWPEEGIGGSDWSVAGRCVSAADLGGDYHDWMVLPDGRVMLAVGDVAGHGIPAALVTAAAKVELGMQLKRLCGPVETLEKINGAFHEQAGKIRPMSLWLGLYNPADGSMRVSVAGHPFAILALPDGATELIGKPGYPLGSRRNTSFADVTVTVPPGGCIVLYSDGIPEALSRSAEPFGYDRLCAAVSQSRKMPPGDMVERLLETVSEWAGTAVPADDQTIVVLSRVDSAPELVDGT